MLVLRRSQDERIKIGDEIDVLITEIGDGFVKLGIEAPKEVPVHREEVYAVIHAADGDGKIVHTDSRGVQVHIDRIESVIQGVRISKVANGLRCSIDDLEECPVIIVTGQPPASRDNQGRIGTIRNVRIEGQGVFADFYFNPKHFLAEQVVWDAEHAPENIVFAIALNKMRPIGLVKNPATLRLS